MKTGTRPVLDIRGLHVDFELHGGTLHAARNVSLAVRRGTTLGLVGESGCGKSVTALSVLRLIAPPGRISSGEIFWGGKDLMGLNGEEMTRVRGREIAMIFQEPMTSLNPVLRAGYQISESLRRHLGMGAREARGAAEELLRLVGIPDPGKRHDSYPHELSGGMRQRVMIAMALAASPALLIADEPTTALDVTIQSQILDLLLRLQREKEMSLLLITHDLGIVANIADEVAIMYAGEIVESGSVKQIFDSPLHPYTVGLFNAIPRIGGRSRRLKPIPGTVPSITGVPRGCVFYPRCSRRTAACVKNPVPFEEKARGHMARCIRA